MAATAGMIVTDGRVLLGSEIEDVSGITIIPRDVRIDGQTLSSEDRENTIRALAHKSLTRGRTPQVTPPQREHFLAAYRQSLTQHSQLVSIHLHSAFDGASREARICRQLFQPYQQIHVYEAKALEGGLAFLLQTARSLAQQGATASQLLALLRYLETHMHTLLLTPSTVHMQGMSIANAAQQLRGALPGVETLWHFNTKSQTLNILSQGRDLIGQVGTLLKAQWTSLRYAAVVRYHGYTKVQLDQLVTSLQAAGLPDTPRLEPITATFVPGMPSAFVELLLLPTETDLRRLRGLVQDPIWWKGAA